MKRICVCCLLCILLVGLLSPLTSAAQTATVTFTPSAATIHRGETFTVTVKISGCTAARSIGIIPEYDANTFELVSAKWLVSGAILSDFSGGVASIAYQDARAFNENVLSITFKVKASASFNTYRLTGTVSIKNLNETISAKVSPASVNIACQHVFSGWASVDTSGHTRQCSVCGVTETAKHRFDNACDTTCNDCGYTRVTSHSYSTSWSSDSTGHWHACTVCGAKTDVAPHTPGEAATENSPQTCTVCGYVIQKAIAHTHTLAEEWTTDAEEHWQVCTTCGERVNPAEHQFSNDCDPTCDVCGYERDAQHLYAAEWENDEAEHWHICTVCGEGSAHTSHVWAAETILLSPAGDQPGQKTYTCSDCGYTKTVEWEYASGGGTNTTTVVVFSAIGFVVGAALGVAGCCVVLRRRRKEPV